MRANFSAEYFAFFTIFAQNPVACAELPHSCLPLDSSAFQPITPRFPSMQKRSPPHNDLTKDTYVKYNDIVKTLLNDPQKRFTEHWDDQAKVPWLSVKGADGNALFAISYENPRSVAIKADYIKEKGLAGAMFWEYGADDENQLAKQLAASLGIPH